MKKTLKTIYYTLSLSILFYSCKGDADQSTNQTTRTAKGDAVYGGTFNFAENEKINSLFPYDIEDITTAHLAWQMYEGLVRIHQKDLSIQPSIAEKWEVNEDQTEYTFYLKKGVYFHDDPCFEGGKGREVKASDVKYSFELACTQGVSDNNFKNFFQDRLAGSKEYYEKQADEISGIKIIDDYTLKITTLNAGTSFLYLLGNPIASVIPKEAYEKYGKNLKVGTGAFRFVSMSSSEVVLARNDNYHRTDKWGNKLPYLDTVKMHIVTEDSEELDMFRAGELSMIYGLPADKITEVVQENIPDFTNKPPKYILLREPEMASQYYELNMTRKHFQNVKVRQALAYAIDRSKILENILNNQAAANGPSQNQTGNYGITPPLYQFKNYDTSIIKGYTYKPELAKKLMAEAGYPNGKGFPSITLMINYGGSKNSRVATEVANKWRDVLGINVEIEQVDRLDKIEDSKYARSDVYRSAWVADYPSPESFLSIAYGKNVPASLDEPSHPNVMRYKSEEFDKYFEMGMRAKTEEERLKYFARAESILMKDCPLIVLWYEENYRLIHSYVQNYHNNPMSYFDLSDIYFKQPVAESKK
jgi:peptide/nickel transport system substrate-binding protein